MQIFTAVMPSAGTVTYLVNLALAVCLASWAGLLAVSVCRRCSAPLRHGILIWTLALILLSPLAAWLAQQKGLALVSLTLGGPGDTHKAAVADQSGPGISGAAPAQSRNVSAIGTASHRKQFAMPGEAKSLVRPGVDLAEMPLASRGSAETSPSAVVEGGVSIFSDTPSPAWWQVAGSLAVLLWATGASVGLFRLGWGCVAMARFCRRLDPLADPRQKSLVRQASDILGLRDAPRVYLSRTAGVPVSIGVFKPAIVLPEPMAVEMDAEQWQAVMLHETAHIARRDHLAGVGQRIAAVLFWWNPLVHWVCYGISDLREEICDNYVVLIQGEGRRLARILVDLAARAAIRPLLPSSIGVLEPKFTGLAGRVARLVNQERNMETRMNFRTKLFVVACGLAALMGMALIGGVRLDYAHTSMAADASGSDAKNPGEIYEFDGQVVDPQGKPLPGAKIYMIYYINYTHARKAPPKMRATTDQDGKFRFSMEKSEFDALRPSELWGVMDDVDYKNDSRIVAAADGYGPQWLPAYAFDRTGEVLKVILKTHPGDSQYVGEIPKPVLRMVKDDVPLVGRIVDAKGKPIAGAKVGVRYIDPTINEDLTGWTKTAEQDKASVVDLMKYFSRVPRPHGSFTDGAISSDEIPQIMPTGISDAEGRVRLTGIGRERIAGLSIEGPGIETPCGVHARTRHDPMLVLPYSQSFSEKCTYYGAEFEHVARPSIPIVGTVRDKDTGKPLAGVTIKSNNYFISAYIKTATDDQGRYSLNGMPIDKDIKLLAVPPADQPYLLSLKTADTTADKDSIQVDFELKQGTWIRGKVADAKTGEPAPCCIVEYYVFLDNPNYKSAPGFKGAYDLGLYQTDQDGRYAMPGFPGRGIVGVEVCGEKQAQYPLGAGEDKIPELRNSGRIRGKIAPTDLYSQRFHAMAEVDPAEGAESVQLDFQLDPGQTLAGVVLDAEGKHLAGAYYSGLMNNWDWNLLSSDKFTVNGYRPDEARKLLFVQLERKLAGSLIVVGPQTGPLSVQLHPWGAITGRVVDAEGKPMVGVQIKDYNPIGLQDASIPKRLWYKDSDGQLQRMEDSEMTDKDGRFRIEGLAPGMKYGLSAWAQKGIKMLGKLISGVTVESGQTKDLGDLKIE
jgi:beta-lactamase regulating signal transducer with metallopeptidase domain